MIYHELNLELRKTFKSWLQQHSALRQPHFAHFDQSWEIWLLTGEMNSKLKIQFVLKSRLNNISNELSRSKFGHREGLQKCPSKSFTHLLAGAAHLVQVLHCNLNGYGAPVERSAPGKWCGAPACLAQISLKSFFQAPNFCNLHSTSKWSIP